MFTLTINTNNDAFFNAPRHEIIRMLDVVVVQLQGGKESATLRDTNGNTVGEWTLTR